MIIRTCAVTVLALALFIGMSRAQEHQPYAGLQARTIKALSNDQIADLRNGRGMGLALAAELNGYPGPAHVIELATQLELSPAQRDLVGRLFEAMRAETIPLGEQLIALESALDRQFADRTVTPESLQLATQAIGAMQGALRGAHLKYHLLTLAELTPSQVTRYATLRGYAGAALSHPHRHSK